MHKPIRIPLVATLVVAGSLAAAPLAAAEFRVSDFYTSGRGVAQWIETATPPPEGDPSVVELRVQGTSPEGFDDSATVRFGGTADTLPPSSPTYDFRASASGGSGGSPRLTLRLSEGGAELRPLNVVAGKWTRLDGQSGWDSYGGTCGYRSDLSYAELLGCHPEATVLSIEIWNDSGWLYPGGYQVLVDNVIYRGQEISNQDIDSLNRPVVPPVPGDLVQVEPAGDDDVLVRLPKGSDQGEGTGRFVPLTEVASVPVGSELDTRRAAVSLRSAVDFSGRIVSGKFSKGRFLIARPRGGNRRVTELRMRGRVPPPCPARGAHAARLGRRLHGDIRRRRYRRSSAGASARRSEGGIRVRARYSTVTAQNAAWTTVDRCDGTVTRVTRGSVVVRDLTRRSTKVLRTGDHYRAPSQ